MSARGQLATTDVSRFLAPMVPQLYVVLDAARPWGALAWLRHAGLPYQCLFEGQKAVELAAEAPYLVYLSDDVGRLAQLVKHVWQDHGGVFIASARPFYDVRRQLRRFLLVKDEAGQVLYFRYYDPRVAASFLPTCDETQLRMMFGQVVDAYLYQADDGSLVEARAVMAGDGTTRVETHRRLIPPGQTIVPR